MQTGGVFNQRVYATRSGWNHIIRPFHSRTKAEIASRLSLLPYAKKILSETDSYQEYRENQLGHFFGFRKELDGKTIKVIVHSQTLTSRKYFYSVMEAQLLTLKK